MGVAYLVVLLFLKVIFKKQVGAIVSSVMAMLILILTFLLQFFLTDVFFGIGPDTPSDLKYSFISALVAT